MILAKFRQHYPQGSLVSELVTIDRGTYIVKASVQIKGVVLATALAAADRVETAEDTAKQRAIATLFLDGYPPANNNQVKPTEAIQDSAIATSSESVRQNSTRHHPQKNHQFTPDTSSIPQEVSSNFTEYNPQTAKNVNFSKPESQIITPNSVALSDTPTDNADNSIVESTISRSEIQPHQAEEIVPSSAIENNLFGDTFDAEIPEDVSLAEQNLVAADSLTTTSEITAMDFNEIKQKTDIEIKRLGWTKDQGKEFLMSHYGKRSRLHLTDEQLLEFLRYLEKLPNPIK
ncbi:MAG: hypothetical protein AAF298_02565 [Cyanobacteria bacterium P01_A01_bin.40]